jgi:glycolate oxidase FAD binding subunit|tara:strand:- start:1304 stop:2674 length:1371 start_codon:yes stop_codon:yes gene_type:complete
LESSLSDRLAGLLGGSVILPVGDIEIDEVTPQAVVRPVDRLQISELLLWASSEHLSVLPRGGGTRSGLGNVPRKADVILDLGAFDQLIDYQPADMTATVEAGMTLATLQERLTPGGEFVPIESAQHGRSTVGGVLAVGAGGPLSHSYGLPREWLIGMSVMGTNGVSTKSGGKVVKNVTGYDLNKLYTGSLGTLGVIVEATFKLLPVDPQSGMLLASFPTLSDSLSAGRKLLHSSVSPMGCHSVTAGVSRKLQDSTQAASQDLGLGDEDTSLFFAFYSGRSQATRRRLEEAAAILLAEGANAVQRIEGPAAKGLLRWITDAPPQISDDAALVMKVSVQSKSSARTSAECSDIVLFGEKPEQMADPGFGTIRLFWPKYGDIQSTHSMEPRPIIDAIQQVRQVVARYEGSAIVEQCPITTKTQIEVWGDYPDSLAIMQSIKNRFDPNGILNPGRFLGGI